MNSRIRYIIGIVSLALFIFAIWYFRSLVAYIFIAGAISIIGQPLVRLIEKIKIGKLRVPRALNASITLICIWLVIFGFFRFFIPLIITETNELSNINVNALYVSLEQPLNEVQAALQKTGYFQEEASFTDYLTHKLGKVLNVNYVSELIADLTATLGNLVIAFFAISFITFFFLKDSSLFSSGILLFVPDRYTAEVKHVMASIRYLLTRYLGGILIEVLLVMLLITFGLWLVGIDINYALICGLFSGILNVIPYVGPWLGALFSIAIGVATNIDLPFQPDLIHLMLLMVLVFASVQTIDNILFQPLIYSSSVNAHPLEIFIVIMMAASLAGVGGMILAIPLYTILRVIAKEFFSGFKVVQKLTRNI